MPIPQAPKLTLISAHSEWNPAQVLDAIFLALVATITAAHREFPANLWALRVNAAAHVFAIHGNAPAILGASQCGDASVCIVDQMRGYEVTWK